jgi:hypothetical protein
MRKKKRGRPRGRSNEITAYINEQYERALRFMIEHGKGAVPLPHQEWDWLAYAVRAAGGPSRSIGVAAKKLGVTRSTIYEWIAEGAGKASVEKILLLSELSNVPVNFLVRRKKFPVGDMGGEDGGTGASK